MRHHSTKVQESKAFRPGTLRNVGKAIYTSCFYMWKKKIFPLIFEFEGKREFSKAWKSSVFWTRISKQDVILKQQGVNIWVCFPTLATAVLNCAVICDVKQLLSFTPEVRIFCISLTFCLFRTFEVKISQRMCKVLALKLHCTWYLENHVLLQQKAADIL